MSRRELAIAILLVMGLLVPLIEVDGALFPQDQTISIVDTRDDKWTTGTGATGIDSWLVHILDPGYDVYSWTIFRGVEINFWEPLKNATLRLYTGNTLEFDKESIITIYGMKVDELQNILPIGSSYAVSVPKTVHYVNLNTSQFYGPSKWWDIDVTDIVEELIRAHNWDGDGLTGGETGDAIGFIMYGAKGHDVRYFVDYRSDPALSAQLVIHWNHEPPLYDPPTDDPIFIEQHGNYSIWLNVIGGNGYPLEPMEYVFRNGSRLKYNQIENDASDASEIIASTDALNTASRKITRLSNGTIYAVYEKILGGKWHIYVKASDDDGETWIRETHISTRGDMVGYHQDNPGIAVDNNDTLHIVWAGFTSVYPTKRMIWYSSFNGTLVSSPIRISNADYDKQNPSIALDSWDFIHVVWNGKGGGIASPQIWHREKTVSWGSIERVSDLGAMQNYDQEFADIAVSSTDGLYVAWDGRTGTYPVNFQIWVNIYNGSEWLTPIRISTYPEMDLEVQGRSSISLDSDDNIQVVWNGQAQGSRSKDQIWHSEYTDSWAEPIRISTYSGMNGQTQEWPTIAVDSDDYLHVVWDGKATNFTDFDKVWTANRTDSWDTPICLQPIGSNYQPKIRWSRWPMPAENGTYFITDLNGTVIENDFDTLEDAEDWIDTIDPDPKDPDPPGWVTEGPFTRFKMRLYLLVIGYFAIWGPIWFMCWRRPSGYHICGGFLIMLMGLGLLLQIVYI